MSLMEVKVPDIGDFKEVEVIELMVKPGDTIQVDQSLITVESDKASMEIPSSHAGVVKELKVKVGDKVAEGSLVLLIETTSAGAPAAAAAQVDASKAHASPSIRKFARELGVDLGRVGGSGPKGRITQEDVQKL